MELFVFSSNRALNNFYQENKERQNQRQNIIDNKNESIFLPTAKSIKEFFSEIIIVENKTKIPKNLRNVLLWNVIEHIEIENLGFDRAFLRFLENSSFLLNFFDELDSSMIDIKNIDIGDTYGDYEDHLKIINKIYIAYQNKLGSLNLYDNLLDFKLNEAYLRFYSKIHIFLDGILSPKDFYILKPCAEFTNINITFTYTKFNAFIFDRIAPKALKYDTKYIFSVNKNEILEEISLDYSFAKINLYSFEMRLNQALLVIAKVNEWLKEGISNIAVILPDESFAKYLSLFDTGRNLNYAMGIKNINLIKNIKNIKETLKQDSTISNIKTILKELKKQNITLPNELELEALEQLFSTLEISEIIDFILNILPNDDDNNGGKVRVLGILETRGVSFERVIIVDFNDEFVPKLNDNDMFLNTYIRKKTNMPTLLDKENLQRHYYYSLFNNTKIVEISFCRDKMHSHLLNDFDKAFDIKNVIDGEKLWRFFPKEIEKNYFEESFKAKNTLEVFSASVVKTFLDCKLKFYFKYLCKLAANDDEEENEGSFIHRVLKSLGVNFDLSKLPALLEDSNLKPIKKLNLEIIKNNLEPFFKEQIESLKNGVKIIALESSIEFSIKNTKFKCYIDRIDESEGKIIIIDYKLKKNFDIKKEGFLQLLIYKKALQTKYNQQIECLYYDLYNNKKYFMNDEESKKWENKLESVLLELSESEIEFSKCEDRRICLYCDYKYLCNRY